MLSMHILLFFRVSFLMNLFLFPTIHFLQSDVSEEPIRATLTLQESTGHWPIPEPFWVTKSKLTCFGLSFGLPRGGLFHLIHVHICTTIPLLPS